MTIPNETLFDVRAVERHITEGKCTPTEYQAYVASLPDDAEEADTSHVQMIVHARARRAPSTDRGEEEEG